MNGKQKTGEWHWPYMTTATAKRFSSTIEYTDHVYCPYQNQGNAKFTLPINALSINIYSRAIPIYVVSIVSIYLHRVGSLTRHQPDYELLSHLDSERACTPLSCFDPEKNSPWRRGKRVLRLSSGCAAMKNSARGDSSTGSELKAVEAACREASRTVEPLNPSTYLGQTL